MNLFMQALLAFILSLGLIMLIMPFFIKTLKNRNLNQVTSQYALDEYKNKAKTPIMGGLLFVIIPVLVFLLINFKGLFDKNLSFVILSFLLYCSVGFVDDMLIIVHQNNEGLSVKTRIMAEFMIGLVLYFIYRDILVLHVSIPFSNIEINLYPIIYLGFMILLYMAEVNAVNFTDGMDGLCAGVSFIGLIPFLIFAYKYKQDNIFILISAILGGLLAYLYFNHHPAKIFMGDSGSLALGGLFTSLALLMDKTIALFFIGGVFVIEMFCVLTQQISVRLFHSRVFSYTPIHYAFVLKGYKETKIVNCFYLLQLALALIGLLIGLYTK